MMKQAKLWTNKYFVALSATIACVLWGSAFPVLKITYAELGLTGDDTASRVVLAGGRFLLAALLLFALLKIVFRQSIRLEKEYILPVLSLGIFQTGLQYFFFYNASAFTGGIKGKSTKCFGQFSCSDFCSFIYKMTASIQVR